MFSMISFKSFKSFKRVSNFISSDLTALVSTRLSTVNAKTISTTTASFLRESKEFGVIIAHWPFHEYCTNSSFIAIKNTNNQLIVHIYV